MRGERGAAWLAGLPGIVEGVLGRWECVPDGGVGVIVPVRLRSAGAEGAAVVKVSLPHPGNVHEPAVDPKGYVGDPAYDAGTLLASRALTLLDAPDLSKAAHRVLDIFAEAAELDRVRVQRWAQLRVVQAAFWGRRHGFRVARGGPGLDVITQFADRLAELLAQGA